ncbi:N-acylglucosamine 2-epimerase [Amycolatopsis mediterranei S699]|uniref:N-acylglucosamine 2-epimerase n=2 Tax=Amycolatopsis mediterranei TaxID=33910 RepID=A0A0H3D5Y6_AMYMU|nr:AGE family epimerase/isomerase [Amycolatopsis mediterranei]ADJ45518.1 N-acylglucosamine 2-epimerase [Amycolatopsis mediterranei U32]AEK42294.1 N-acylglucosamine 2-epimerase [Amycolatopsis mediterranei S699]AFO77231.1 N-acylglucosamine 2-epimerase [Amycolatopsis mediterranei S699]AGT84359.1 N-acylglucosamine 2-epimerase [Amycolatopsis mediterranei RB]KDO06098.1 N-acyl-D-glucosamine 2-epimerase [Amycolatopsis mediterranei]
MPESRLLADEVVPAWLAAEPDRLLEFARASRHPEGGFTWLDERGRPVRERPVETWITCRMTHVFALAAAEGRSGYTEFAEHGIAALTGLLRDDEHGGWFASATAAGPVVDDKRAYEHGFVILATASAAAAGIDGARVLLDEALAVFDERFWEPAAGLAADVWDRGWTRLEPYRGANANMHAVEALLAAAGITGDPRLLERAARIVERLVGRVARGHGWRLPEHFTAEWTEVPEYHRDDPAHPFRPYGVTIGHLFEWARLAVHVRTALGSRAPEWLLESARCLFDTAVRDGWSVDGADGFVYTTDFAGTPVVRSRLHWVVAEAMAAAWVLHQATGDAQYLVRFRRWCEYAEKYFVDRENGSWHHELDHGNAPAAAVWPGKPDVYHAYQAALITRLPVCASFAGGVVAGRSGGG